MATYRSPRSHGIAVEVMLGLLWAVVIVQLVLIVWAILAARAFAPARMTGLGRGWLS